jgi:hypothetical protein
MNTAQMIVDAIETHDYAGRKCLLWNIRSYICAYHGNSISEAAISARIRDTVRPYLQTKQQGWRTVRSKAVDGKKAHHYWVAKMTRAEIKAAKEKTK